MNKPSFYEFFAGGGMARVGLGEGWQCSFSNDFDAKKAAAYRANWGDGELHLGDIFEIPAKLDLLPGRADLAWASFPCQDLSLAGNGIGLLGQRSSAFWGFHDIVHALALQSRAPKMLVLENVIGLLTSNGGRDFAEICSALKGLGYIFGALTMDAKHFLPQSRPRLFIVALGRNLELASSCWLEEPVQEWSSDSLMRAYGRLSPDVRAAWRWWNVASPSISRTLELSDIVEDQPHDVKWHSGTETARLISMMSQPNLDRLDGARRNGGRMIGTIYKRTRLNEAGAKVQRAELRMDGVAGCLRTPGGGSSRQLVLIVENGSVRTRLLSAREAARLMGLPDSYVLPTNYNEAYHLLGDGLAIAVVRHLGIFLEKVIVGTNRKPMMIAAE